jgi:hypothetical protein
VQRFFLSFKAGRIISDSSPSNYFPFTYVHEAKNISIEGNATPTTRVTGLFILDNGFKFGLHLSKQLPSIKFDKRWVGLHVGRFLKAIGRFVRKKHLVTLPATE